MTTAYDYRHLFELRRGRIKFVPLMWADADNGGSPFICPDTPSPTQDKFYLGVYRHRVQFTLDVQLENDRRLRELLGVQHLYDLGLTPYGAVIRMALLPDQPPGVLIVEGCPRAAVAARAHRAKLEQRKRPTAPADASLPVKGRAGRVQPDAEVDE